jgi:iron complex transport system ATP-binding protein
MIVRMFEFFAAQGVAILVVLHDLNLAAKCANQILVLKDGHSAATGTPEVVLTEGMLKEVFSISAKVISNPVNGKPMVVT